MRHGIIGRLFPWLSEPLEDRFGHRKVTHSLLVYVALALLLWSVPPHGIWLALVVGFASHPVGDMLTPTGVEWFWPARWRCVLPGNERFRMRAMEWGELIFAGLLAMASIPLLSMAQAKPGTGGVIVVAIGDISTARHGSATMPRRAPTAGCCVSRGATTSPMPMSAASARSSSPGRRAAS